MYLTLDHNFITATILALLTTVLKSESSIFLFTFIVCPIGFGLRTEMISSTFCYSKFASHFNTPKFKWPFFCLV